MRPHSSSEYIGPPLEEKVANVKQGRPCPTSNVISKSETPSPLVSPIRVWAVPQTLGPITSWPVVPVKSLTIWVGLIVCGMHVGVDLREIHLVDAELEVGDERLPPRHPYHHSPSTGGVLTPSLRRPPILGINCLRLFRRDVLAQ